METVFAQSTLDQRRSACKQMKNAKKNTRGFISKPSENLHKGILSAPPPLSLHNYQQQPPSLLPLAIQNSLPSRSRYLSCPPANRKPNKTREQSLITPRKSKQAIKRENEAKLEFLKPTERTMAAHEISESFIVTSVKRLGPEPNDLPKNVSKVLSAGIVAVKDFEKFSGSVFTISPPPSSLPLPNFSLRPKLISCNAEVSGIDARATDNLRRLLRLR